MIETRLNEKNSHKLAELSRQTGDSPDELANKAVERFIPEIGENEQRKFQEWRQALLRLKGMWADRRDLPDFQAIRRSMDRDWWEH